jgi:TolB-like protein/Flp pilus assembly protein TadD
MGALSIRLLGGLELERDGVRVDLPRSRKTRALLAFLAATATPQPRERLCAMFWDVPDDPRGALRWSLSKLRALVDDANARRIVAERDTVAFDGRGVGIDAIEASAAVGAALSAIDTDRLEAIAGLHRGSFLEGLDLTRCPEFHAWSLAERERLRAAHAAVRLTLIGRLEGEPERAIAHAAALVRLDPADEAAHATMIRLLARLGRRDEARRQAEVAARTLEAHGVKPGSELANAWRSAPAPLPAAPAPPAPAPMAPLSEDARPADGRPVIAVLPFQDLGEAPDQRYFADGITQDIATNLARFSALMIIATQSSFGLRDRPDGLERALNDLGATYVLQGSVRRGVERVRIVANLMDARSGQCLWSERYDRDAEDIFEIQDDVARQIAATLSGKVFALAHERNSQRRPQDLLAYDYFLRGSAALARYAPEDNRAALAMFEQALKLEPDYAAALGGLAQAHIYVWFLDADERALDEALIAAERALQRDPHDAWCNMIVGRVLLHRRDFERARHHYERAVDLNPSCADILASYSYLLTCLGRSAEAVKAVRDAIRLNPGHSAWYDENLGNALFARGRYDEALDAFRRIVRPPAYVHGYAAACLARLGRLEEARAEAERSMTLDPTQSIERHRRGEPYLRPEDMDDLLDALRLAGLPEHASADDLGLNARSVAVVGFPG